LCTCIVEQFAENAFRVVGTGVALNLLAAHGHGHDVIVQ